jgi:hypothetical protein
MRNEIKNDFFMYIGAFFVATAGLSVGALMLLFAYTSLVRVI